MAEKKKARLLWYSCPRCACEHFISLEECRDEHGGPWCSRCLTRGIRVLLAHTRQIPDDVREKALAFGREPGAREPSTEAQSQRRYRIRRKKAKQEWDS